MTTNSSARPLPGRRGPLQRPGVATPSDDAPASPSASPVPNPTQAGNSSCTEGEVLTVRDRLGNGKGKDLSTEKVVPQETSQGRRLPEDLSLESGADQALDKTSCLKCSEGGELLACSEDGCPIVIHEKCLDFRLGFDESGRFYCPYCAYKRVAAKVRKLRWKAMLAEKKLNSFLNPGKDEGGGKKLEGEKPEASDSYGCCSSRDKSEENDNKEANDDGAPLRSEPIHHLPEKTTSSEDLSAGHQSEILKSKPVAGPTVAVSLLGDSSRGQNKEGNTRNQTTEGTASPPMVGPQVMPQSLGAISSEERSSPQRISSCKLVERDPSADQSNLKLHHPRKVTEANGKRKRLYWRPEEEDMLKEAVRSFLSNINKNLPWRKILEYGRDVFDETRTPSDIKDKWKTMTRNRR